MQERHGQWKRVSTKVVHANPFYLVREDQVIKPDGSKGVYYVTELATSVFIVALDDDQNVYLIELHRYTNDNYSIEVPGGRSDDQAPLVAAKRELQEETGLVARTWKKLGVIHASNGIIRGKEYVFLATDLAQTEENARQEEGIREVRKLPLRDALRLVKEGGMTDTESIAALTMAALDVGLL